MTFFLQQQQQKCDPRPTKKKKRRGWLGYSSKTHTQQDFFVATSINRLW